MNRSDVITARDEAVRFIKRADALLKAEFDTYVGATDKGLHTYESRPWNGQAPSIEAAAVKRASLDLSRALSFMRRRS